MAGRRLTEAAGHSGRVVGTARWPGHVEELENSSPVAKIDGAGSRITGAPRKSGEGERGSEGLRVVGKME